MRIKIQQFLFGKLHSWSVVGQNIGRALIKLGHDVEFVSTDGFNEKFCPQDLKPYVKQQPTGLYDCQISYTAPHNWANYLANGSKNKFGIWNYEYNIKSFNNDLAKQNILQGFAKYCKYTTKVLPSSNFAKDVFLNMGIPEDKQAVIPHGINLDDFKSEIKYPIKTNKSKKILLNIAQPHKRKALHLALESYGKAFTKNDDVCFVAKVSASNKGNTAFDVDFLKLLKSFKNKYKNHAEIILIQDFIPNIVDIYNSCNIHFSTTHAECFFMPGLETLAAGLINVIPNYGGQLDFCNENNSLLIKGNETRSPRDHQYWQYNPYSIHFTVDTDDAAEKLNKSVKEYDILKQKFDPHMKSITEIFTWDNVAKKILSLCE